MGGMVSKDPPPSTVKLCEGSLPALVLTTHHSPPQGEGETLNDTKANGVNDIITYDT